MASSNSSNLDSAVIGVLQNDSTLSGLLPDGIWMDEAPPNSLRFGIVTHWTSIDREQYSSRAIEEVTYAVTARALSTAGVDIKAAAQRIDELLENYTPTITDYDGVTIVRVGRIRDTEVDQVDPAIRWYHRGGKYRLQATPTAPVLRH